MNRPYWSEPAFNKYINFMNASFQTFTGVGEDAKIKTYPEEFKSLKTWNDEWIAYFSNKKEVNIKKVRETYGQLIKAFSEQFGFEQQ